jgi:hypothetical protein
VYQELGTMKSPDSESCDNNEDKMAAAGSADRTGRGPAAGTITAAGTTLTATPRPAVDRGQLDSPAACGSIAVGSTMIASSGAALDKVPAAAAALPANRGKAAGVETDDVDGRVSQLLGNKYQLGKIAEVCTDKLF